MKKIDTIDEKGFKTRVALPDDNPDVPLEYGIELGLDLREVYPDIPPEFLKSLQNMLFDRGFVEAKDALKPNAFKDIRSAILSVVGYDAHRIIEYLKSLQNV